MTHKARDIDPLAFYRRSLLTPDREREQVSVITVWHGTSFYDISHRSQGKLWF